MFADLALTNANNKILSFLEMFYLFVLICVILTDRVLFFFFLLTHATYMRIVSVNMSIICAGIVFALQVGFSVKKLHRNASNKVN